MGIIIKHTETLGCLLAFFQFWLERWKTYHFCTVLFFHDDHYFFLYFIDSSSGVQNIIISGGKVGVVHAAPINVCESKNVTTGDNVKMSINENESSCKLNNLKIYDAYFFPGGWNMVLLFLS